MSDPLVVPLIQRAIANPSGPLLLPADPQTQRAIFTTALTAIETALDTNRVTDADQIVALAWRIAAQTGEPEHHARAHWCSGLALLNRAHAAALEHYAAARAYFVAHGPADDSARVLLGYGMAAGFLGRLDVAETALQEAMQHLAPLPDHPHWMRLYLNRSLVLGLRGRYMEMYADAGRAVAAAEHRQHRLIQASALVNQGMAAMALGRLDEANALLTDALARADTAAEVGGRALVNLARLAIYQGRLFAALHRLDQARTRFAAVDLEIDRATVAIEAAHLYERLHMLREAQQQAVFAAETFAQAGLPPESVEARLLAIRLALARGRTREVSAHLDAAQVLADSSAPTWQALLQGYAVHPDLLRSRAQWPAALAQIDAATATLHALGAVAEELDLALLGADLAARLRRPDARTRYETCGATARQHGLIALEQRACLGQAGLLRPQAACSPLQRAADLLASQRRQMPVEELKASLLHGSHTVYVQLVEAQRKSRRPDAAVTTLLEAKGGPWADLATPAPVHPPDAAWLAARTDLTTWQEERRFADDPAYIAVCEQHIRAAEAALTAAARHQTRPRDPQPLPTLAAIQSRLTPGQVLIDYLVGSTHLHACLLRPDAPPHWVPVGKQAALQAVMGRFSLLVKSIHAGATPEQRQAAAISQRAVMDELLAQMYELLLAPLLPMLPASGDLLIAPDAFLFEVPWAALRLPTGYLGERSPLLLVPSAVVPGLPHPAHPERPAGSPLALGYAGDPPLLHVAAELAALQQALPALDSRLPASTHDLRSVTAPDLLHIAAHGQIRRDAPLLSALALADGPFLLAEALNLDLHGTRLVTLSACDTGTVPERGGVLLALAGSFLVAGAGTVLASLWPVEDATTRVLMGTFYTAVQAGMPLPQALQQAQQVVRAQGDDHPLAWSAFHLLARCV
jgi:CHAT domain-containing protein/tetratricopeptide (TPR) repeat protein